MIRNAGRSALSTNTNLLVALDALLTTCNVTQAAKQAGITQSSMSGVLSQLRELLGDPLLVRAGRTMEPTPHALQLMVDLRQGVEAFERVLMGRARFDPTHSEENFVLALSDRIELVLFAALVARVQSEAPGIGLQVVPWGRLDAPPGLASGGIDLSIGILLPPATARPRRWESFPQAPPPGHHTHRLFDSGLRCIVRDGHPRVGKRMTLATFCKLEHVLVTEQLGGSGVVDDALARLDRRRRIAVRVPRHVLVGELIANTDLVATIDRRVAVRHAERHGLRVFEPPVKLPLGSFGMIWHARTHVDPARRWLREQVAVVASELLDA